MSSSMRRIQRYAVYVTSDPPQISTVFPTWNFWIGDSATSVATGFISCFATRVGWYGEVQNFSAVTANENIVYCSLFFPNLFCLSFYIVRKIYMIYYTLFVIFIWYINCKMHDKLYIYVQRNRYLPWRSLLLNSITRGTFAVCLDFPPTETTLWLKTCSCTHSVPRLRAQVK